MEYIVIVLLIIYIIIEKISNKDIKKGFNKIYKPKIYLITKTELEFYKILKEIATELNLLVFCQVSLYNILTTRKELEFRTKEKYFRRIASKSIDFVLADPKDCKIKLCIELDDNTHKRQDRIERDNFINQLFKELEIDLLRIPVYKTYYKETIKNKIKANINDHYYTE